MHVKNTAPRNPRLTSLFPKLPNYLIVSGESLVDALHLSRDARPVEARRVDLAAPGFPRAEFPVAQVVHQRCRESGRIAWRHQGRRGAGRLPKRGDVRAHNWSAAAERFQDGDAEAFDLAGKAEDPGGLHRLEDVVVSGKEASQRHLTGEAVLVDEVLKAMTLRACADDMTGRIRHLARDDSHRAHEDIKSLVGHEARYTADARRCGFRRLQFLDRREVYPVRHHAHPLRRDTPGRELDADVLAHGDDAVPGKRESAPLPELAQDAGKQARVPEPLPAVFRVRV